MAIPKINPLQTTAWKELAIHFESTKEHHLVDYFREEDNRAENMHIEWRNFYLDYSKNRISEKTRKLLLRLADEVKLKEAIKAQFSGEAINETEKRAVGHTELRNFDNMKPEVSEALRKMEHFSEKVISGEWKGYTGKRIKSIVNIGIGGSDLGPDMVCEALRYYRNELDLHFISNVEGDHVRETLKQVDPETTLFIIVSKSFTTQETLTNAQTVRKWFLENAEEKDVSKHFVSVSTNLQAVATFGIARDNIFPIWDWVGGRFSLWSAVGLSICCAVGYRNFRQLLKGAEAMDNHFRYATFEDNIPVMMALISVWYNNFFKCESEAVVPYSQYLQKLVPYLQQAIMESNGKSTDRNGNEVHYQTGTIVWGSTGTNAQHAFFQLLHQGTKLVPVDFICFKESLYGDTDHQQKLIANCLAQSEALMEGTYEKEVENQFKVFKGNRPSNTLLIERLTPETLGSLIAIYEHKLFVQGVIWNIFSYDQWGVELGKKLAKGILDTLSGEKDEDIQNTSTKKLIEKVSQ
ncbi:glucose-6-phosphate isomerase [Flavobacteriaceae bacterium TK19130]|nr:glucose-6-phosphate isomerase [Thermobacterium salinum]